MARGVYGLLKETIAEWIDDKATSRGAALAYYSMFAIGPIVILTICLAGLVYGEEAASGKVAGQLKGTLGDEVAGAIESLVRSASNSTSSTQAAVIGLVVALFGAAAVFLELQDALNTIWKVTPRRGGPILGIIRERAFSFAMVLAAGLLLLGSLIVTAALNAIARFLDPASLPGGVSLWQGVNWLASFAFVTFLFALIFKIVPDVRVAWREVWAGAALTGVLFTVGKYLLAIYLTRTSVVSAYGAAGSLAVVLVWVYYSAQILLFGAEFTHVQARRRGSACVPTRGAVAITAHGPG
ncbi:MAG TPA: YihY/virulence factor BrkB family protein [Gemmataceae bacterium]|nr:YihY/virulence factor BrkB family protein [Gemmataceae bacterium]